MRPSAALLLEIIFMVRCDAEGGMGYSLENSHNPFIFKGRVAAIFMVRLWFAEP